eukprot:1780816-Pleurochrysis_carterae.AAC.1
MNYPEAPRRAAQSQLQMHTAIEATPMSAPVVEPGRIFFIVIPEFEGEMRVGVGCHELESGVEEGSAMVACSAAEWMVEQPRSPRLH